MSSEGAEKACVEGRGLALRILLTLFCVAFGWGFYGFVLFWIGIGYMNPKLPQYYGVISLFAQFLPYLASIACLIAWLITWRFKWLKWSLAALLFLVAGTLALQRLQAYLPPGPLRDGM